jgi:hypothetical protein
VVVVVVVKHGDGDQISWNHDVSVGETGRTLIDSILNPAPSKRRPPRYLLLVQPFSPVVHGLSVFSRSLGSSFFTPFLGSAGLVS